MVATRAQRAQASHDEPATTSKKTAVKAAPRRGKKATTPAEDPTPEPKSSRAITATRTTSAKKATKPAASSTRKTRAKDAEPEVPASEDPVEEPEASVEPEPTPVPAQATRKTPAKATPKPTSTRKRPARDVEPESAPPAKRQTRTRAATEERDVEETPAEKPNKATAPTSTRSTRATKGTKASETRAATVKPLAQRVKVTAKSAKKTTSRKTKEEAQPEQVAEVSDASDVEMEEAEPEDAKDETPIKPTRNSKKTVEKEAPEEKPEEPKAPDVEMSEAEELLQEPAVEIADEPEDTPVEETAPATPEKSIKKSAKKSTKKSTKKTAREEPQTTQPEAEIEAQDEPQDATLVKSTRKSKKAIKKDANEEAPQRAEVEAPEESSTPVKTPVKISIKTPAAFAQVPVPVPVRPTPTKTVSTKKKSNTATVDRNSHIKQMTPAHQTSPNPPPPEPETVTKDNAPVTPTKEQQSVNKTAKLAATQPILRPTPAAKPVATPKTVSIQAKTPFSKSALFHETPRKAFGVSPFKFAPMSAAKPTTGEAPASSMLMSPAKKAPFTASALGMTPMRTSTTKREQDPNPNTSTLATPARKGLMLPPSTAPVHKFGMPASQSKSSLLQTCPRKIALPGLPAKSSMATPSKAQSESNMSSSLFGATPRKVQIQLPPKDTSLFGTSAHDFVSQAQSSALGTTPRRLKTPARTPAKRFATPGKTPAKLLGPITASPTPIKATPAGLRDVSSAVKMLHSPELCASTPTEQIMLGVIDNLDHDMPDAPGSDSVPSQPKFEEEPQMDVHEEQPAADEEPSFEHPVSENLDESIYEEDSMVEDKENEAPVEIEDDDEVELYHVDEMSTIIEEESSFIEHPDEEKAQEENAEEHKEEPSTPRSETTEERPSTPEPAAEHIEMLVKEKAKTEKHSRSKRLSLAIQLEDSIKKPRLAPRQSLAFIPSLSPTKSALRSPFKKPFGSPKKSVAFAPELEKRREEPESEPEPEFEVNIPRPDDSLLSGTVFYVDVRSANGEDAGDLFVPLLEEMGARITSTLDTINSASVTHVLFKDGAPSTLERVIASGGAIKAVNIGWALDCERFNRHVSEAEYQIDLSRLAGNTPLRDLTTFSANATPAPKTPSRQTPAKSAKGSAFGTPFKLVLTPKPAAPFSAASSKPLSPFGDIRSAASGKENTGAAGSISTPTAVPQFELLGTVERGSPAGTALGPVSPGTPYFLHAENITQKTCPPKQLNRGLFDRVDERGAGLGVTPFKQKLLFARRSLSPAHVGGGKGLFDE